MKITDADYEDHIAKLESGFKATFGEDLAPYLVTQMCFDLLAAKKIEYVKSYLRTWSGMELFNLADRMLKRESTNPPPGLRGVVTGHGPAAPGLVGMVTLDTGGETGGSAVSRGLANNGDLEKATALTAAALGKSWQASVAKEAIKGLYPKREKKIASIEQARAKRAVEDISKTPPKK